MTCNNRARDHSVIRPGTQTSNPHATKIYESFNTTARIPKVKCQPGETHNFGSDWQKLSPFDQADMNSIEFRVICTSFHSFTYNAGDQLEIRASVLIWHDYVNLNSDNNQGIYDQSMAWVKPGQITPVHVVCNSDWSIRKRGCFCADKIMKMVVNGADPDETARYQPARLDLHCPQEPRAFQTAVTCCISNSPLLDVTMLNSCDNRNPPVLNNKRYDKDNWDCRLLYANNQSMWNAVQTGPFIK